MSPAAALLELGERYAALGLPEAARAALARAHERAPEGEGAAARRLAELALAAGDAVEARAWAEEALRRERGAEGRYLLARAQLADGEVGAARLSFSAVLESGSGDPLARARALLGRSEAAVAEGDRAGAEATALSALDEVCAAVQTGGAALDRALALAEEVLAHVTVLGRAEGAAERLADLSARGLEAPAEALRGLLLATRQAQGETDARDRDVEVCFERALEGRPEARAIRLRLAERLLRRRHGDGAARERAARELEALAEEAEGVELARVYFLLAAAHRENPARAAEAERAYREGLALRPGHAAAADELALLALSRGDTAAALAAVERALRIDPDDGQAWRNAVRVIETSAGEAVTEVVTRCLDAGWPGAGGAAGDRARRLMAAAAEVARGDVLDGMHARAHRLKNLLGLAGARVRSARKAADGPVEHKLAALERELTGLYDEWTATLRSMQVVGPALEVVPLAPLVAEVVEAAARGAAIPVHFSPVGGLPDLRGDRTLLREALANIVGNAVEAAGETGGRVDVRVRQVPAGGAPVARIEVADTGPGIPPADLARLFAPGFTTKGAGSGIGLAVAERAVTAHHGRILVESEVGQGTQITVLLPTDLGGFASLARSGSS